MGLVVGDALGVPVEFMTRDEIRESSEGPVTGMRGHGTYDVPSGTWSDDSSMALATLVSLNDKGTIDLDNIMRQFTYWQEFGEYTPFHETFDEGLTCRAAIDAFKKDGNPKTCGVTGEHANGNGALMRILPLCLFVYEKVKTGKMIDEEAIKRVHEVAALTHNHLRSCMCCGVYYFLVKAILTNKDKQVANLIDILQQGMDAARCFYIGNPKNANEMRYLDRVWNLREFQEVPKEKIKSSGYVIDTLEAALWCLIRSKSYRETVLLAVNLGDDTDTVASVTGGLAGLFYGYDNIPSEWIADICSLQDIVDSCEEMANVKFRFGLDPQPYRQELLKILQIKHPWVDMELLNSIEKIEIEEIAGEYEFVRYFNCFGKTMREVLGYKTTGKLLELRTPSIADELIRRNPVVETYRVTSCSTVEDSRGWHLECYEIRKHALGGYSLFQQAGDRMTGGFRVDMINPAAFKEKDYDKFLQWVPHCGLKHEELLADKGLRAFFGY